MAVDQESRLSINDLQQLHRNPETIPARITDVLKTLTDENEEVRAWAVDCLQAVERLDASQVEEVARFCNYPNDVVVHWACRTLAKATDVTLFQDQLADVLDRHPSAVVKQSAAGALSRVSKLTAHSRETLQRAADSKDASVRRVAKLTLETLR